MLFFLLDLFVDIFRTCSGHFPGCFSFRKTSCKCYRTCSWNMSCNFSRKLSWKKTWNMSGKFSWKLQGRCMENKSGVFRKCSRHVLEVFLTFPGFVPELSRLEDFCPEIFRLVAGNFLDVFRKFLGFVSATVPEMFRNNSGTIPEHVREIYRKLPANFPECSRTFPANIPEHVRTFSGKHPACVQDFCGAYLGKL